MLVPQFNVGKPHWSSENKKRTKGRVEHSHQVIEFSDKLLLKIRAKLHFPTPMKNETKLFYVFWTFVWNKTNIALLDHIKTGILWYLHENGMKNEIEELFRWNSAEENWTSPRPATFYFDVMRFNKCKTNKHLSFLQAFIKVET